MRQMAGGPPRHRVRGLSTAQSTKKEQKEPDAQRAPQAEEEDPRVSGCLHLSGTREQEASVPWSPEAGFEKGKGCLRSSVVLSQPMTACKGPPHQPSGPMWRSEEQTHSIWCHAKPVRGPVVEMCLPIFTPRTSTPSF